MKRHLFAVVMEDGTKHSRIQTITQLINLIKNGESEVIVFGEFDDKDGKDQPEVLWEKQFNACTVMPPGYPHPKAV